MKLLKNTILVAIIGLSLVASNVRAGDAKTYQVTGPVLEVNPTYIVVQKDADKWQIDCDKATAGNVKVGDKVTIKYVMVAKTLEVKPK